MTAKSYLLLLFCILTAGVVFFVSTARPPTPQQLIARQAPALTALAAVVVDPLTHRIVFQKESGRPLALASLTKIMTAVVSLERQSTISTPSPIFAQAVWSHTDLMWQLLVASSNEAAVMLESVYQAPPRAKYLAPETQFVSDMNAKARTLSLEQMHFKNVTGLDESTGAGGVGTAEEVASLFWYAYQAYPKSFSATAQPAITINSKDGRSVILENTNAWLGMFPHLLASKTGTTDFAGGNLAIIFEIQKERPLIAVVLGSTPEGRYTDMLQLVQYAQYLR